MGYQKPGANCVIGGARGNAAGGPTLGVPEWLVGASGNAAVGPTLGIPEGTIAMIRPPRLHLLALIAMTH